MKIVSIGYYIDCVYYSLYDSSMRKIQENCYKPSTAIDKYVIEFYDDITTDSVEVTVSKDDAFTILRVLKLATENLDNLS